MVNCPFIFNKGEAHAVVTTVNEQPMRKEPLAMASGKINLKLGEINLKVSELVTNENGLV